MFRSCGVPVSAGSPGRNWMRVSNRLPQYGASLGSVDEGGVDHDNTARSGTTLAPLVQSCRHTVVSTGRLTAYCTPPAGTDTRAWTCTTVMPRNCQPPTFTQNATYSGDPVVHSEPE